MTKRPAPPAPAGARPPLQYAAPALTALLERGRAGCRWAEAVRTRLEPAAATHVAGAVVNGSTLVVLVDSPAWAARLRYLATGLLHDLRGLPAGAALAAVRVQVAVTPADPKRPPPRPSRLSPAAADFLRHVAESTGDPELRSTFAKLSRRAHKPS